MTEETSAKANAEWLHFTTVSSQVPVALRSVGLRFKSEISTAVIADLLTLSPAVLGIRLPDLG